MVHGTIYYEGTHGHLFRFCGEGDPPFLEVLPVRGATSAGGSGDALGPGAICRTASHVTVCSLPDGVSHVVANFAVFEQPPPQTVLDQASRVTASLG